eukprot:scaffold197268_cov23-Prasinocladus_malaysianus.AAC.1
MYEIYDGGIHCIQKPDTANFPEDTMHCEAPSPLSVLATLEHCVEHPPSALFHTSTLLPLISKLANLNLRLRLSVQCIVCLVDCCGGSFIQINAVVRGDNSITVRTMALPIECHLQLSC